MPSISSTPNLRRLLLALAAAAVLLATSFATWQLAQSELRSRERERTLSEISAIVDDNANLIAELQKTLGVSSEGAILAAYLERIRRDGVPRHSGIKRLIDQLVNNNTVVTALVRRELEVDSSIAFRAASRQYVDYTVSLRDRWQSVFEIFMAGGNLPADNGHQPLLFGQLLKTELAGKGGPVGRP